MRIIKNKYEIIKRGSDEIEVNWNFVNTFQFVASLNEIEEKCSQSTCGFNQT